MIVLVVFMAAVVVLAGLWIACGGRTAEAKAQQRAVREVRRQDQARLRHPWHRDE